MKLDRRGFTLVELLAMLTVLGILMAVTVPNITGILNQSKTNVMAEDVEKLVTSAKTKVATNERIKRPKNGECLVFTLDYLDDNDDYKEGPNGGVYDKYDSFVIMKRVGSSMQYHIRLVEETEDGDYGVNLVEHSVFKKDPKQYIDAVDRSGYTEIGASSTITDASNNTIIKSICTGTDSVKGFYKEV